VFITSAMPVLSVGDVDLSTVFYGALGFEPLDNSHDMTWVVLHSSDGAGVALVQASAPVHPDANAVVLYRYADNIELIRATLMAAGGQPGPIVSLDTAGEPLDPFRYIGFSGGGGPDDPPAPDPPQALREMRVTDPDGYPVVVLDHQDDLDPPDVPPGG
jgi:hypothetical protein